MLPSRLITLMCFGTLLLTSLACVISFGDPAEIVPPAIETAEEAARNKHVIPASNYPQVTGVIKNPVVAGMKPPFLISTVILN